MKAKLAAVGTYPDGGSPEVLGGGMRAALRNWAKAIQISGAVAE